jgi:uncharacterized Tic20 family protein
MCSRTALDQGVGEITPSFSPGNTQDRSAHRKAPHMTEPGFTPATPQPAVPLTEAEDRQWASFAHLGGIIGFLPSLIIWLVFKDRGRFTDSEAKEALNFQISLAIALVALSIVSSILSAVTFGIFGVFIAPLLYLAVWVVDIIWSVQAFIKTKDGFAYRYPASIRLIK